MSVAGRKMVIKITEDMLQAQCVEWFRLQYPDKIIFAIPNGEKREQKTYVTKTGKTKTWSPTATRLKKLGVLAGVPDLCIPHVVGGQRLSLQAIDGTPLSFPINQIYGLYIEMKSSSGTLSGEQKKILNQLEGEGYQGAVCYTFDEFVGVVKEYFGDN